MTTNFNNYNFIRGFFDSDGSWGVKVYIGSEKKPVSFHVNITFSQKDPTVLESVLASVGATDATISKRTHLNPSGNTSQSSSISIALSNTAGQTLLNVWANDPPVSPTKYLDYRIVLVLQRVNNESALSVVNQLLPSLNISDLRIASLALLYLRYQMYGASKTKKQASLVPIEKHYQSLKATTVEIEQSIKIGEQLYAPIKRDVVNHVNNLVICEDYLLGYHTSDGCFSIQTQFNAQCTSFKANFTWSLTDCIENKRLLETIKTFLESKGITFTKGCLVDYTTYMRLQITSISECSKLVKLFDQWGAQTSFSNVRLNQYQLFSEALRLYQDPKFRTDYSLCSKFIELKWKMNPGTNAKKKGSLHKDMAKLLRYYNKNKK